MKRFILFTLLCLQVRLVAAQTIKQLEIPSQGTVYSVYVNGDSDRHVNLMYNADHTHIIFVLCKSNSGMMTCTLGLGDSKEQALQHLQELKNLMNNSEVGTVVRDKTNIAQVEEIKVVEKGYLEIYIDKMCLGFLNNEYVDKTIEFIEENL